MSNVSQTDIGIVRSLWRYPVKSMKGEALSFTQVNAKGFLGDRMYAILDGADGRVATAKNPKKWPNLFAFQASLMEPKGNKETEFRVRIILPDGTIVTSEQKDLTQVLSKALNRDVTFAVVDGDRVTGVQSAMPASWTAHSEEYWPDIEGRDKQNTITDFALPAGTFFDSAMVHLLSTATLNRLGEEYPQGRFEPPRFRPNLVVESVGKDNSFAEDAWIGRTLAIGDEVRLQISGPCGRCVMTTLAQGDLPKDTRILRTAVQHHQGHVGVYAAVERGGTICVGDGVRLDD